MMKGCIVSVNLHSLHHDPIYWKDPNVFQPERHLLDDDNDGRYRRLKRSADHHFLPFSAGTVPILLYPILLCRGLLHN